MITFEELEKEVIEITETHNHQNRVVLPEHRIFHDLMLCGDDADELSIKYGITEADSIVLNIGPMKGNIHPFWGGSFSATGKTNGNP